MQLSDELHPAGAPPRVRKREGEAGPREKARRKGQVPLGRRTHTELPGTPAPPPPSPAKPKTRWDGAGTRSNQAGLLSRATPRGKRGGLVGNHGTRPGARPRDGAPPARGKVPMALSARDGSPAARDADDATEDLLVDTVPLIGKAEGRGGAAGGEGRRHLGSMFLLGLMNNSSFVVLAASAKDLVPGNVGLVYVCSSLPSFLLRLSAPYWLDMVSYRTRVLVASALMPAGFTLVATGSGPWQMLGIVFCSLQQGLGECSALALSSRFSPRTLTLWSSGTGLAGIFGYAWVVLLSLAGLGIRQVLLLANVFVLLFLAACRGISRPPAVTAAAAAAEDPEGAAPDDAAVGKGAPYGDGAGDVVRTSLSWRERLALTLRLWRWTVPLFAVYAAEYAMQAGVWSAIGFPVESAAARQRWGRRSRGGAAAMGGEELDAEAEAELARELAALSDGSDGEGESVASASPRATTGRDGAAAFSLSDSDGEGDSDDGDGASGGAGDALAALARRWDERSDAMAAAASGAEAELIAQIEAAVASAVERPAVEQAHAHAGGSAGGSGGAKGEGEDVDAALEAMAVARIESELATARAAVKAMGARAAAAERAAAGSARDQAGAGGDAHTLDDASIAEANAAAAELAEERRRRAEAEAEEAREREEARAQAAAAAAAEEARVREELERANAEAERQVAEAAEALEAAMEEGTFSHAPAHARPASLTRADRASGTHHGGLPLPLFASLEHAQSTSGCLARSRRSGRASLSRPRRPNAARGRSLRDRPPSKPRTPSAKRRVRGASNNALMPPLRTRGACLLPPSWRGHTART